MLASRRILAVCPARGGSKGIPLKNLRPFLGVPLVARVGRVAARVPCLDRAVVSTDHPEIAAVARESGLEAPFMRPPDLSGDRIGDAEVLAHALRETERRDGVRYDVVVMLQPTSPLRRPEHVTATVEKLVREDWDAVWTVSETDSKGHPLKQLVLSDAGLAHYDPAGARIVARQQLEPVYHRNGVAYALTRECLLEQGTTLGARTGALMIEEYLVSIDTLFDLELAEWIARQSGRT